jgi:cytochrome c-type biogenesis protein CcmH/NrfF
MQCPVPSGQWSAKKTMQVCAVFALTLLMLGAGDEAARFDKLGNNMMCACGCRQILLQCNHVGCQYSDRMRNELISGLQRGESDDLVVQAFVQKYGQTVLAAPMASGFNWVAWIMPFVALIAGLAIAVVVALKWRSLPQPAATSEGPPIPDAFRQRARKETEL